MPNGANYSESIYLIMTKCKGATAHSGGGGAADSPRDGAQR